MAVSFNLVFVKIKIGHVISKITFKMQDVYSYKYTNK